ncbi:unnamed protein product, partial [Amoebophrya sp. A25]
PGDGAGGDNSNSPQHHGTNEGGAVLSREDHGEEEGVFEPQYDENGNMIVELDEEGRPVLDGEGAGWRRPISGGTTGTPQQSRTG